ncbi:unnamed protein product [Sphenostylis stenocarpa]|uniref:Pentatricopeptide repeat-containing protein n=1 Tax=Sphenostylis stenocarpa TaxID=92480 RepID=A0AA86SE07_9FABA|nr:unnamed protein product [Sphenostylis stenocarpa]
MLPLRSTRTLCHSASEPILLRLKSETDPDTLFHLFQSNATNRLLVENRFAFRDTVTRLAAARRFDHIHSLLHHQTTLPQARREGFLVRIISLYGLAGMTDHALRTFHHARGPRTVKSFNAALKVLALSPKLDSILEFLSLVPPLYNIQLDVFSINIAIKAFCDLGKLQEAYLFMVDSENKGISPDAITFTTLISAFYKSKSCEIGNGLWNRMVLKGCMPTLATFNVRIQFLVNNRRAWDANKLMDLMQKLGVEPDEVTFNLVIKGFCVASYLDMAKRVYSALHGKGCKPNAKIYQTMIHYLCKSRDFDLAYTMCKDSMTKNWFPDVYTICMLLEGLKGSDQIAKAIVIMTLVRKRIPPFASEYLASMQSILSRS